MKSFMRKTKKAQSLVEYGLILALVSVVAIAALQLMGGKINTAAETAGNQLENASDNAAASYCTSIGKTINTTTGICE